MCQSFFDNVNISYEVFPNFYINTQIIDVGNCPVFENADPLEKCQHINWKSCESLWNEKMQIARFLAEPNCLQINSISSKALLLPLRKLSASKIFAMALDPVRHFCLQYLYLSFQSCIHITSTLAYNVQIISAYNQARSQLSLANHSWISINMY